MLRSFLFGILLLLPTSSWSQEFYKIVTDPITVTFQPQFGNTSNLLNSMTLGTNNWKVKVNIFDLKWEYSFDPKPLYGPQTKPDFRHLMERDFVVGVDYALGPANSTSVLASNTLDLNNMQQVVTVYMRLTLNGRELRESLTK